MNSCDIAWAAGLFEGEGTVCARERDGRWRIAAQVTTTDHDVILRFCEVVACGLIHGPYNYASHTKPQYKWSLNGWANVRQLRDTFDQFLGSRRLEQFANALAREEPSRAPGTRTHCPSGHSYAEHGSLHKRGDGMQRRCKACARDYYHRTK